MNIYATRRWVKALLTASILAVFCTTLHAQQLGQIDLQEDWGIEPVMLRVTAGGYMIEFRYKILDTEKALIMSDPKNFPSMLALKSKAKLSVPFGATVGFLKSNRKFIKLGKNYTAMFSNEGQHLLPGDEVRIQIRNQLSPVLTLE